MPPVDDELRALLHHRAGALAPLVDPVPGVERRVRRTRRRRLAAAAAGTALAVLAVVSGAALLVPGRTAPGPSDVASPAPSASPAAPSFALDLDRPWAYRGDPAVLDHLPTWQRDWGARHPGAVLVPLFGQVWEPSALPELVFASRLPGADALTVGVATTGEAGSRFLGSGERALDTTSVPVVLGADEGGTRLLLVASPQVGRLEYVSGAGGTADLARLAPGVGTVHTDQPAGTSDSYLVLAPDGTPLEQADVPDEVATDDAEQQTGAPSNTVGWRARGDAVDGATVLAARQAYAATRRGSDGASVEEKVLFAGTDSTGRRYLLGQFWVRGDRLADTFAAVLNSPDDVEAQLYRPLGPDPDVLAMELSPPSGTGGGTLVVVPRPGTGQVLYSPASGTAVARVDTPSALDGVAVFPRSAAAERPGGPVDVVRLLDGDGREIVTETVFDLLCGKTSCG